MNFVESIDTLAQNLREVSPTVFASVPRIWEKFASLVEIRMSDSTVLKKTLYRLAVLVGLHYVRARQITQERFLWSLLYWPLYGLVLYHLKRQLGLERVRYAVCAAARRTHRDRGTRQGPHSPGRAGSTRYAARTRSAGLPPCRSVRE